MNSENINIVFVDTNEAVVAVAATLQAKNEICFDTEFDRFWREYGFKLFLLQIFDGENCYLIDPLAVTDLSPIWQVFENDSICKVAYACLEDVQLLKTHGCNIKNVFDVQVLAKFSNQVANSFAELVADICHVTIDKNYQLSNWRKRPLLANQLTYASNDVIWLLAIKSTLLSSHFNNELLPMLSEENLLCEAATVTLYTVKLSNKQQATLSTYHANVLLQLFAVRNTLAEAYNIPPATFVADNVLEKFVLNKHLFTADGFSVGFSKLMINDEEAKAAFSNIIQAIDAQASTIVERKKSSTHFENYDARLARKATADVLCKAVAEQVKITYGSIAGEYIMRGIKRELQIKPYKDIKLRQYQQQIFEQVSNQLQLSYNF